MVKNKNKFVILFIFCYLFSGFCNHNLYAYEKYTWSELVTGKKDKLKNYDDEFSYITEWCGLSRIVKKDKPITFIQKNALRVVENKKSFSNEDLYKAVMDLRYLYKYVYKDDKRADDVLKHLDSNPVLRDKAEIEKLFSSMNEENIINVDFYSKLSNLKNKISLFPYDNGYMPVITLERVFFILSIKEMLDGKGYNNSKVNIKCWKNLPSDILYDLAIGKRDNAYNKFLNNKSKLQPECQKLIEDYIFPLYMPLKKSNRKFITALYCVEEFHNLGINLLHESLTNQSRVTKPEHALACLADVYMRHNAHQESQKVFNLLSEYYPDSIWLK